ncbi:MAG: DoxX family protein [Micrococcales bacterium]
MDILQVIGVVIAWALSIFVAIGFYKAGKFKLTASKETLLGAGFGWVKNLPMGIVRLIAALELLGAVGIILAPIASEFLGFAWAQVWGVLAAAGLALTMLVAAAMHIIRGEFKYTYKSNLSLFFAALIAAVLLAAFGHKLF